MARNKTAQEKRREIIEMYLDKYDSGEDSREVFIEKILFTMNIIEFNVKADKVIDAHTTPGQIEDEFLKQKK